MVRFKVSYKMTRLLFSSFLVYIFSPLTILSSIIFILYVHHNHIQALAHSLPSSSFLPITNIATLLQLQYKIVPLFHPSNYHHFYPSSLCKPIIHSSTSFLLANMTSIPLSLNFISNHHYWKLPRLLQLPY